MIDYHAHITVKKIEIIPKGWKRTDIVLENVTTKQYDIMLTKHYRIGVKGINSVNDILKDIIQYKSKFDIIRVKIEQDSEFTLPITLDNYIEVHAKCNGISAVADNNWVRSTNPKSISAQGIPQFFFTKRFYSGNIIDIQNAITDELATVSVSDLKIEQVIYDSNREHDAWWA